jgi:BASS family bile acid:Na+ symporter
VLSGPLIDIGLPVALFLIMTGMGLTLTPRDFREVLIAPRGTAWGLVAQVLLLPLLAFGLALLLQLEPALAVGLVVIAACPGGTASNIFAFLGGGDVALSVILTVLASLVTIITLPLYTSLALEYYGRGGGAEIDMPVLRTVIALLVIVVVPLLIGMLVRHLAPNVAAKGERAVGVFGLVVLVVLIVLIMAQLGDRVLELARKGGIAALFLNIVGLALGWLGGRLFRLSQREAFTVAIELGIKNGTLGLMVTLTLLHSSEMSVPSAVYGVMMFATGFAMLALAKRLGLKRG